MNSEVWPRCSRPPSPTGGWREDAEPSSSVAQRGGPGWDRGAEDGARWAEACPVKGLVVFTVRASL